NMRLEQAAPQWYRTPNVNLAPLRVNLSGDTRLAIYVLLAAVLFVLLIACSNVANLVLARGAAREREMAIRIAVGATRSRLIAQLLTGTAMLAFFPACSGLLLAGFGIRALIAFAPANIPRLDQAGLDPAVLAFTLAISLAAAILFGLAPAWKTSKLARSPRAS